MPPDSLSLAIHPEALRPLIKAVVVEAMAEMDHARTAIPADRLAYSEAEAARLVGLNSHQLRDERRRGKIAASLVVGKRVRYLRDDLVRYLMAERTDQ